MTGPLVVIPGFMGSQLTRADNQRIWVDPLWAVCNATEFLDNLGLHTPTDPRLHPDGILHDVNIADLVRVGIYRDLHEFCIRADGLGLDPRDYYEFAFDWRKTLASAAEGLAEMLLAIPNPPVSVIAHSQGGLVLSALFANAPTAAARIERIFAVGCPFAGLLKTIAMLEYGTGVLTSFFPHDPIRSLLIGMPATYELLPSSDNPGLVRDRDGTTADPFAHPDWFPSALFDPTLFAAAGASLGTLPRAFPVPLRVIEGYGVRTYTTANWDGATLGLTVTEQGDGTCPAVSLLAATGTGLRSLSIPFAEHVELVRRPEFLTFLRSDLVPNAPRPLQVTGRVRATMLPTGTPNLLVIETRDPDGNPLGTGAPTVTSTAGLTLHVLPTADGARWSTTFSQPRPPQQLLITVPGIPTSAQPPHLLIVGT